MIPVPFRLLSLYHYQRVFYTQLHKLDSGFAAMCHQRAITMFITEFYAGNNRRPLLLATTSQVNINT